MLSDWEIAKKVTLQPIQNIASKLGVHDEQCIHYGKYKAKIDRPHTTVKTVNNKQAKLILVTAINPTPAGEGKTTTTIGLGDGLQALGKNAAICLREPSLGPCFGVKGGATGGGWAQVGPLEDINLHFTGDFHAITTTHNLLAATIDNKLHWGNARNFDPERISWRRVMDMNERALRDIVIGLGGKPNGAVRQSGFDITVASEIMAILCLAKDSADLQTRLERIVIGYDRHDNMISAGEMGISGAMMLLLKDAFKPNLVQTLEGNPALIHGGPFANIAHGCNSLVATQTAMQLADYVVTEAGFGADLGAEKFFHIKCRAGNLQPSMVVLVATVRALKMHGGIAKNELANPNLTALQAGLTNLGRHIGNVQSFGMPVLVALNKFATDSEQEIALVQAFAASQGVQAFVANHFAEGSLGITELAQAVINQCEQPATLTPLYDDSDKLLDKITTIATQLYGAKSVETSPKVRNQLNAWENAGFGKLPVCMAKTPMSFSADPKRYGAPKGHILPIREVRLCAGAGFVVALCGDVMTMPGLPKITAAESMGIDADGNSYGLA